MRLGHVRSIEPTQIVPDNGIVAADPDTLYIDCSAAAIVIPPKLPVFDGLRMWAVNLRNMGRWRQHAGLSA